MIKKKFEYFIYLKMKINIAVLRNKYENNNNSSRSHMQIILHCYYNY